MARNFKDEGLMMKDEWERAALRKFEEMRGRVEQSLAHGFGGLGLAQGSQAFHSCRRFKQKERLFQRANLFCPRGRSLVVALGEEFCQRSADDQQACVRGGWARQFAKVHFGSYKKPEQSCVISSGLVPARLGRVV